VVLLLDNGHYLAVAKVRERLAVSKQAAQKMDIQTLNLKKLNKGEDNEHYQVTITNKFAALENLMITETSIRNVTLLKITSKFQPKRVSVIVNRSIINHCLITDVQNR
jgi:hypothetical protein